MYLDSKYLTLKEIVMDFLSSAILSGIVYDMLKHHVSITATSIKEKLKNWVIDEAVAPAL
ncbi:hypothetical protein ACR80D_005396, partial [Escherichia coli]